MKTTLTLAVLLSAISAAAQPARAAEPILTHQTGNIAVPAAGSSQTRTLADVAAERKAGVKGVRGGTLSVAGAPAEAVRQAPALGSSGPDEAEWTARNANARGELAKAQSDLEKANASLPSWSVYGRGSAYAAAVLDSIRQEALLPYRMKEAAARAEVSALPEAARKAGAYPGWVRGEEVQADRKISARETERQLNNGDAPLPARERDDRGAK